MCQPCIQQLPIVSYPGKFALKHVPKALVKRVDSNFSSSISVLDLLVLFQFCPDFLSQYKSSREIFICTHSFTLKALIHHLERERERDSCSTGSLRLTTCTFTTTTTTKRKRALIYLE